MAALADAAVELVRSDNYSPAVAGVVCAAVPGVALAVAWAVVAVPGRLACSPADRFPAVATGS
ncbi:MAG: hypothetical protein Aurels2KO_44210 [Aureliella sp.]